MPALSIRPNGKLITPPDTGTISLRPLRRLPVRFIVDHIFCHWFRKKGYSNSSRKKDGKVIKPVEPGGTSGKPTLQFVPNPAASTMNSASQNFLSSHYSLLLTSYLSCFAKQMPLLQLIAFLRGHLPQAARTLLPPLSKFPSIESLFNLEHFRGYILLMLSQRRNRAQP